MAESQNIEWKESWRDEYLKWICGFANAQGGKIYIGTNDDGTVIGIQDSKKLMEDIPNKVRDILGIIVDVNLLSEDGKEYIEICVSSNTYPVRAAMRRSSPRRNGRWCRRLLTAGPRSCRETPALSTTSSTASSTVLPAGNPCRCVMRKSGGRGRTGLPGKNGSP